MTRHHKHITIRKTDTVLAPHILIARVNGYSNVCVESAAEFAARMYGERLFNRVSAFWTALYYIEHLPWESMKREHFCEIAGITAPTLTNNLRRLDTWLKGFSQRG